MWAPRVRGAKRKASARPMLQMSASLTHVFTSTSTIRETLGSVDLLADGGIGIRGQMAWKGPSYIASGTAIAPDLLTFAPSARFDLKVFTDLARLFGTSPLTKGARITIAVENIGNSRQTVRNQAGTTPLGYQSIYRDPLGRMVSIELRKVF